ncbi:MAG: DnaA regulatory inactivator Hda, partial [Gammaproteobacteria bacterium]|nr:DnaA regulatory inactivator Hda [Gammaproteobacteria bacterium]
MSSRSKQIPLPLGLPSDPSFANFITGSNREARAALGDIAGGVGERVVCLWGQSGTGKTHLLRAVCREAVRQNRKAVYLSCRAAGSLEENTPSGFQQADLICIDDMDTLAGNREREDTLFYLYNLLEARGTGVLVAGEHNPAGTGFSLRDLESRLTAALVLRLHPLDDDGKRMALKYRAKERGFTLSDEVVAFLLRRCHRDMHSLFVLLDTIDEA